MSFSFSKLKSFLPGHSGMSQSPDKRHSLSLEPELGFQLILEPVSSAEGTSGNKNECNVPELNVHLISARHLPSTFGFKSVQGYCIKVKLFPGSKRYDSNIQTSSWPKFNENFRFPMGPELKPSLKRYNKETNSGHNLPAKLFNGHFIVFTVYALLELPPGGFNRFKGGTEKKSENKNKEETIVQLTKSESRRNIGSVTCFLDPKIFKEIRSGKFTTEELWLPIKDITATTHKHLGVNSSPKGQLELILELCDSEVDNSSTNEETTKEQLKIKEVSTKKQFSLTDMKRIIKTGKSSKPKELYLKVTTSKIRLSIKVKEEFEALSNLIYVKTTIFEHDIFTDSWKSEQFLPSLSTRWDPKNSNLIIPINDEKSLKNMSIRTRIATKTKMGKKIILGTVLIGPNSSGSLLEHWENATRNRNEPFAMWHNFQ